MLAEAPPRTQDELSAEEGKYPLGVGGKSPGVLLLRLHAVRFQLHLLDLVFSTGDEGQVFQRLEGVEQFQIGGVAQIFRAVVAVAALRLCQRGAALNGPYVAGLMGQGQAVQHHMAAGLLVVVIAHELRPLAAGVERRVEGSAFERHGKGGQLEAGLFRKAQACPKEEAALLIP